MSENPSHSILVIILLLAGIVLFQAGSLPAEPPEVLDPPVAAPSDQTWPAPTTSLPPVQQSTGTEASPEIPDLWIDPAPAPDDPCLPPLYRNWREFALDCREIRESRFQSVRIVINSSHFQLAVEVIGKDGSVHCVYETPVALGSPHTPTPQGRFVINHLYCYPDVIYFDKAFGEIPGLYKAFFAPVLLCDEAGRCRRYRDLGLHGYDARAYPNSVPQITYGPASAGCIRVPDPCKLKKLLIRLVGVGPLRKDDRGSYHWFNRPIEVAIGGEYPWIDEASSVQAALQDSLKKVQSGLEYLLGILAP